jgi:DnaJ like chaperone protein
VLHPEEERFLGQVAKCFGFTDTEFSYIKARHVSSAKRNPYEVLGISPTIGNDALKMHYRKLVANNHPDKMIARGVSSEFVTIATEKIAAINAAYDAVARERRTRMSVSGH